MQIHRQRDLLSTEVLTHLKQIERIDQKLYQYNKKHQAYERSLIAFTSENGEIQLSLKATSFQDERE